MHLKTGKTYLRPPSGPVTTSHASGVIVGAEKIGSKNGGAVNNSSQSKSAFQPKPKRKFLLAPHTDEHFEDFAKSETEPPPAEPPHAEGFLEPTLHDPEK